MCDSVLYLGKTARRILLDNLVPMIAMLKLIQFTFSTKARDFATISDKNQNANYSFLLQKISRKILKIAKNKKKLVQKNRLIYAQITLY
jgi:hypothetical protein